MQGLKEKKPYIAELRIPTFFYRDKEVRESLDSPEYYGIKEGYWVLRSHAIQPEGPPDPHFTLIIGFDQTTLKDAENHALKVGSTFSSLVSGYSGQPVAMPVLDRIALTDSKGNLVSQAKYLYGHKSQMLAEFNPDIQYQFQRYLQHHSSFDNKNGFRLRTAVNWYGISMSANDPAVGVVAAWTGLEYVGPLLFDKYHPKDEGNTKYNVNNPCNICGYEGNSKRFDSGRKNFNRGFAGIQHAFQLLRQGNINRSISDELIVGLSAEAARDLRGAVVHGLEGKDGGTLEQRCEETHPHLMHVLNASILNVMGPSIHSWIAGHYEIHPDYRSSLKFREALPMSPYCGEWVEGTQLPVELKSTDPYIATGGFEWSLSGRSLYNFVEAHSKEPFKRDADVYDVHDEANFTELTCAATWYGRQEEPEWEIVDRSEVDPINRTGG